MEKIKSKIKGFIDKIQTAEFNGIIEYDLPVSRCIDWKSSRKTDFSIGSFFLPTQTFS